jgi:hypothetical protein
MHRDGYKQRNQKESIKKWARQGDLPLRKRSSSVRIATAMPLEGLAKCSELLDFLLVTIRLQIEMGTIPHYCGISLGWMTTTGRHGSARAEAT